MRPGVDDLVVALAVRDVAGLVRALEPLDALLGFLEQRLLLGRNVEIFDADRDAAARGVGGIRIPSGDRGTAPCPASPLLR